MAIATNAFITMFNDEISNVAQQTSSKLQDSVRTVRNVVGNTYKFPVLGKAGVVVNKAAGSDLPVMSGSTYQGYSATKSGTHVTETGTAAFATSASATINTYSTGEYVDNFEQLFTNADLRSGYATAIASAMNRAYDDAILTAMGAATMASGHDLVNQDVTKANLIAVHKLLNAKDVPMEGRCLVIGPEGLNDILTDTNLIGAEAGPLADALVSGSVAKVMGFNVIVSNLLQAGSTNASDNTGFAWHPSCVGMAVGKSISAEVNYIPEKLATLVSAQFSGGATVIDNSGIVSMEINQA